MSEKYNGWANYETWCVALWLNNDEASYHFWRQAAHEEVRSVVELPHVQEGIWTHWQAALIVLAERIRDACHENEKLNGHGFYGDLLISSLERVDWQEIAADFLTDVFPKREKRTVAFLAQTAEFRFELGRILSTPGALRELSEEEVVAAINRHVRGDWGLVDEEDARTNNQAIEDGLRVLSAFDSAAGQRFWIITEADRSVTTVLLPDEY